jgi:hypothetical protein
VDCRKLDFEQMTPAHGMEDVFGDTVELKEHARQAGRFEFAGILLFEREAHAIGIELDVGESKGANSKNEFRQIGAHRGLAAG